MITRHRLPDAEFLALSHGHGGSAAVRILGDAQLSRHLLLIRFLAQAWPTRLPGRDDTLAVLAQAQANDPDGLRGVVGEPMVGAWAALTARRIRGSAPPAGPVDGDLSHLSAVAAAAAARCAVDAALPALAREGRIALPTLGTADLGHDARTPARIAVRSGRVHVQSGATTVSVPEHAARDAPGWQGLRRLSAGSPGTACAVMLDDLDPYRGGHHAPPAPRLTAAQAGHWDDLFREAWSLVTRYAPDRAAEVAAGLRAMVPLADLGDGAARSATARDAFGAFGLTCPASPADLAVTLVHEFQHSKLSGVMDLVPLYEDPGTDLFFAPWRLDARPIGGLYQGVYAFLGVADIWHRLMVEPDLGSKAEQEFAVAREQVHCGLESLVGSGLLTTAGHRFATGMRESLDRLFRAALPPDVVSRARAALRGNRLVWAERNRRTV